MALAFQAFFAVLRRGDTAERVRAALGSSDSPPAVRVEKHATTATPVTGSGSRSDALTLLMVLQRDAHFLDLVGESLHEYSDEQIGCTARSVLQNANKALERMFGIQRITAQEEGERIEVPANASPVRWRIIGKASATSGRIEHPGWMATKVDLPQWTGQRDDAMVLAPIEVDAGS
ncbi:MAG: DUF2760 domain-containing protein [Planctomycetota bacterium]